MKREVEKQLLTKTELCWASRKGECGEIYHKIINVMRYLKVLNNPCLHESGLLGEDLPEEGLDEVQQDPQH